MAAITKRLLHLRINTHSSARPHPYPLHHFSSSSDPETPSDIPQPDLNPGTQTLPSFSSGFSDVKSSLQRGPPPENRRQIPRTPPASGADSNANIRRQLSEFRARTAAPPPSPSTDQFISLQELYERNVNAQGNSSAGSSGGKHSFNPLRTSLRQINPGSQNDSSGKLSNQWSVSNQGSLISAGRNESFTPSFLRKETRGKDNSYLGSVGLSRMNDHLDLGKKLKALRPQNRKGKWFSLQELNDRLAKLRGAENQERDANHPRNVIASVRDGIKEIQESGRSKQMKNMNSQVQSIGFLGSIGGTESYNLYPPKTDLVEKYFHPDNMSSAEKLKLELKKVRDEFKMSESDCGSARVQVAQLTTKIKHLSTVLQKKDKHSRRGLLAMVQRRKKLLKYLRRTDWDSYCVVLSKLGLRDNPDIKA